MRFAIGLLLCSLALALAQIEPPQIGVMLNRDGAARPVLGTAGSTSLGAALANDVISIGCSPACLIKTNTAIVSATGSVAAPPGPALFSFSGDSVLVYFAKSRTFARWRADQLDPVASRISGDILAIAGDSFVVRRPGGVWIVNSLDQPVGSLPSNTAAALLLDGSVVYATAGELTLRHADQSEQSFPLGGAISISRLGPNYVQIRTASLSYALRVDPGHERLFLLPEPE